MASINIDRGLIEEPSLFWSRQQAALVTKTILLVEDEEFVRKVTSEVLLTSGFRVLSAANVHDARSLFESHHSKVDLVLTDMIMPGGSGKELTGYLRERAPGLPIIVTSGYGEHTLPENRLTGSGIYYLPKPYSAEVLVLKVHAILESAAGSCS